MASVIYIARDIERALGKRPEGDYFIITNKTPYAKEMQIKFPNNIYLMEKFEILDTYNLLTLSEVEKIIRKHKARILVFKNTTHIEELCREKKWEIFT